MRKSLWVIVLGLVIVVMLGAGFVIVANPTAPRAAEKKEYGESVQIDDFAFAVRDAERTQDDGRASYVVSLQVINRAKRVPFQFRPDMAVLLDEAGNEYLPDDTARRAWYNAHDAADACAHEIAAGTECETVVVYDVPATTSAPVLKIRFGGGILEIADALLYGNRVIQLK